MLNVKTFIYKLHQLFSMSKHIDFTPDLFNEETIIDYANTLDQSNFKALLMYLDDFYYNGEGLISDKTYDNLREIYEAKYGTYNLIGSEPIKKIKLPFYLGSLNKVKEENELNLWKSKYPGPYILEDKIDGLTLLLVSNMTSEGRKNSLYTRGNGYYGSDVTHLLSYLNLPLINEDIIIRGEAVLTKDAFKLIGNGFKNARNLISGIVNSRKNFNEDIAKKISFYAYHILNKNLNPEDELNLLSNMGFLTPTFIKIDEINQQLMKQYYEERKIKSLYEIDGIVIYQNKIIEYPIGESPKHIVAFKGETQNAITTVTKVEWNVSKNGLLKPIVHFDPVKLSGVDISKATGHNAKFIIEKGIGPGAKIIITRSGDVIPKIISVVTPVTDQNLLYPNIGDYGDYEWNETKTELITVNKNELIKGKILHFLTVLEINNFGKKRVEKLVNSGVKSISDLLNISEEKLCNIQGIGSVLSKSFYNQLHKKIQNISLSEIMDASGMFPNIGKKSFEEIIKIYPNLLEMSKMNKEELSKKIRNIKGFKTKADKVVENLPLFVQWLNDNKIIKIKSSATLPTPKILSDTLNGMTVVFSGFRDEDLKQRIIKQNGRVTESISGKTNYLVMKDINEQTKKKAFAESKNIPIFTLEEFIKKFNI